MQTTKDRWEVIQLRAERWAKVATIVFLLLEIAVAVIFFPLTLFFFVIDMAWALFENEDRAAFDRKTRVVMSLCGLALAIIIRVGISRIVEADEPTVTVHRPAMAWAILTPNQP
jgi:hypothetical protein